MSLMSVRDAALKEWMFTDVLGLLLVEFAEEPALFQHFGEPDHSIEWSPQLVGHVGEGLVCVCWRSRALCKAGRARRSCD